MIVFFHYILLISLSKNDLGIVDPSIRHKLYFGLQLWTSFVRECKNFGQFVKEWEKKATNIHG